MTEPTLSDLFRVFGRIGVLSFGGPAAQISLMHTELVDRNKWLSEQQFLGALSFCMLLPGPEAMQLATYAGWRLHGVRGGILAGLLFVLPGAAVILALALGYAYFGDLPVIQSVFLGIQAAVIAIVFQALLNLSRKALLGWDKWAMALCAFSAIFVFAIPFPVIVACAGLWGFLQSTTVTDPSPRLPTDRPSVRDTAKTVVIWAMLWLVPLWLLWLGDAQFLLDVGLFFSTLAVVTFGGAYAVLAYMTQAVVETHGWLSTGQMIDALGLAETTPGPLILVTQFVGILAGFETGGLSLAIIAGLLTLWVTFTPCFLWIFAGAPFVEDILARPRLKGALAAISASVVGVILNLSVWFALHVLFERVDRGTFGPSPEIASFLPMNAVFVALACGLYLWLRLPMLWVLLIMALTAGATHFFA